MGYCISRLVPCPREMDHPEFKLQRLLYEVPKPRILDVIERSVPKDLTDLLVIDSDKEFLAAKYENSGFIQSIYNCQSFSFDGCIICLVRLCEAAADKGCSPSCCTTKWLQFFAAAVFL